jgi:Rrf2 family protein
MKFSKKSRYGLTALIDLTVHSKNGHVALNSIAERNDISPQYLEQVFASLRRAGIVKSVKGPQGGYLLNDSSENITVAAILNALDGSYQLEDEVAPEGSAYRGISVAIQKRVVDAVNTQLDQILKNLTLADLEKDYLDYNRYDQSMYYI